MINPWLTENIYITDSNLKKGKIKVLPEDMVIPRFCDDILKYNYNIKQLKQICKHYKLKQSGNKCMLSNAIYNFLKYSKHAKIIQRSFRTYLLRRLNYLKGRSLIHRKISTNQEDFISLDDIRTISPDHYFSFECNDHNYGFNIKCLYQLILKSDHPKNPYNRNDLSGQTIVSLKECIRLSNILKIPIDFTIETTAFQSNKFKMIELFHIIDQLGNYSDYKWLFLLNKPQLIKFYKYLYDIWIYRAQLPIEKKQEICSPTGNPFIRTDSFFLNQMVIEDIQKHLILVMNNLLTKAVDNNSQKLGAYYILGALTLVNHHAANAIPWLYESFMHL